MINLEIPARYVKSSAAAIGPVTALNATPKATVGTKCNGEHDSIVVGQMVSIVHGKYKGLQNRNRFLVSGTYMKTPARDEDGARVTLQPCFSANATVVELKGGRGFMLIDDVALIDENVDRVIKGHLEEQHSRLANEAFLGNKTFNVSINKRVLGL
mgnify:CR=1 FL=1